MSDLNDLPKEIPNTEHIFSIDVVGDTTKKQWKGSFRYRVPSLRMKASAERMRATLNGSLEGALDPSVQVLHMMISYLRYTLAEVPEWWKDADYGYDLYDFNVVDAVYKEVEKFQNEWTKSIWGEPKEEQEESGKSSGKAKK